jgi:glycogen operon protein
VRLAGDLIGDLDERGEPIVGDTLLLLLNAHHETIPFTLPAHKEGQQWEVLIDTNAMPQEPLFHHGGDKVVLGGRSMAVLRTRRQDEARPTILTPAQVEKILRDSRRAPVASGQPT